MSEHPLETAYDPLRIRTLFTPGHTIAWPLLCAYTYPWEALTHIRTFIQELGKTLSPEEYDSPQENVWIHKTAKVYPSAFLGSHIIVGANTEIRHCAFLRENACIGSHAVVGNSTELKNVILFDNVQVPHYNYVGDSILGYQSHMGAGSITSNVKSDKTPVTITVGNQKTETGLKKFGAILGDHVEIGCGSVLNPGTIIGSDSRVYPLSMVRGYVPPNHIYKQQGEITQIK